MKKIILISPRTPYDVYTNYRVINTTSRSTTRSKELSPFILGPVTLYGNYTAKKVENGWQYSKCYPEHVDAQGNPTENYFEWATKGWSQSRAERYPMGKGTIPLYSYWNGLKLSYVEARKNIFVPLYSQAVLKTEAFKILKNIAEKEDIALWDFDVYDHIKLNMSLKDVINCEDKTMGHGFILYSLLTGESFE